MQHRERIAEAAAKASDELRAEPDLRNQHERLAPGLDHLLDERQVDLGLSAPGNAVEEIHAEIAESGPDIVDDRRPVARS